ncbi:glucan biosynthesis protein G [bacterium]|nr:glucan biosynthesis protein G [bacterium]
MACAAFSLVLVHRAAAAAPAPKSPDPFDMVVNMARILSQSPYDPAEKPLPAPLETLTYDQYRDIRFRPSATMGMKPGRLFRIQFFSLGYLFRVPVEISTIEQGKVTHVSFTPEMFETGKVAPPLPEGDIGFSGFRLLYPINKKTVYDEVAVFQGASYFRSLGRDQAYGLSARGLALRTGSPNGEEFLIFRRFWIEEPRKWSRSVVVYALLDGPSVSGAYRFEIAPGDDTVMDVRAVLFPRVDLTEIGIAPGTSMYFFSPNGRQNVDDFRPHVHDSDGLLMVNGRGEQIWRPLANPARLQISGFQDASPRGFGLMQRNRNPHDYQDFESHFERRPSLWVEPAGDWGEGSVILVEIPSNAEIHDNIVSFWRPGEPIRQGSEYAIAYKLQWGGEPKVSTNRIRVIATAHGRADATAPTPVRRFVIDYSPDKERDRKPPPDALVTASAGQVSSVVVSANPLAGGHRVAFAFDPGREDLAELRVELKYADRRVAETWLYRWTKP